MAVSVPQSGWDGGGEREVARTVAVRTVRCRSASAAEHSGWLGCCGQVSGPAARASRRQLSRLSAASFDGTPLGAEMHTLDTPSNEKLSLCQQQNQSINSTTCFELNLTNHAFIRLYVKSIDISTTFGAGLRQITSYTRRRIPREPRHLSSRRRLFRLIAEPHSARSFVAGSSPPMDTSCISKGQRLSGG